MLYPIFMDDWQYNGWYHDTHAIDSVHGTEGVFDFYYSCTETLQALFWLEVKHSMFSVFWKNVQTSICHMLIKCHIDSIDAHSLLKNYEIIMKILFMPKHMHKVFMLVLPTYILPPGKKHSNHSSSIGSPNGYLLIEVHHLAITECAV